jgi:hypothetical protein
MQIYAICIRDLSILVWGGLESTPVDSEDQQEEHYKTPSGCSFPCFLLAKPSYKAAQIQGK